MRFVFFTKTLWEEPPRIRHQLAEILMDAGYKVLFFERPSYFFSRQRPHIIGSTRLITASYKQLLHHKLRFNTILRDFNAKFEKKQIRASGTIFDLTEDDVIINFNYDYYFLKELFPRNRLITLINDNFWSSGIFGMKSYLKSVLKKTVISSDVVLTVSEPIFHEIKYFCEPEFSSLE